MEDTTQFSVSGEFRATRVSIDSTEGIDFLPAKGVTLFRIERERLR